jgi:hypothetical protein
MKGFADRGVATSDASVSTASSPLSGFSSGRQVITGHSIKVKINF